MTEVDLASRSLGGSVVAASDESFGFKEKLIDPAEPAFVPGTYDLRGEVVDGWETRRHAGADGDWVIIGALALSGLGMGASSPALASSIANAVDDKDLGIAGAAQQMANQVGVALGIQVMLAVQTAREASVSPVAAYGEAYLVAAGIALAGVVLALFVRSSPRVRPDPPAVAGSPPSVEQLAPATSG